MNLFSIFYNTKLYVDAYLRARSASALLEAAFLFPIFITMTFGIFDLGYAILARQKVINASQITADLVARERSIIDAELDQAEAAALLAIEPLDPTVFGIDIVGIQFDINDEPQAIWRETRGAMSPNPDAVTNAAGLGVFNEGVIAVTVEYRYVPTFSKTLVPNYTFREVSYFRGRRNSFIPRV